MTYEQIKARLASRINDGTPFFSRELSSIAQGLGVSRGRADSMANSITQDMKGRGIITPISGGKGGGYLWQKVREPPPPPPPVAPYVAVGPYDPPPALEGPNSGLTEAFAEHLWHALGGGDRERTLRENTNPMESRAWRMVAEQALGFLFERGMVGPAGKQRAAGWTYAWVYEADNWEIIDADGGGVALVLNDGDVPMMLAAPRMCEAIQSLLLRFEERGAVKRSDVDALRHSLPGALITAPIDAQGSTPAAPAASNEEDSA